MTTSSSAPSPGVRNSFDTGPLSWVIGEIREALNRSRAALHEAAAQDADARLTPLRHAKSYLHQAHGALQIVDVDGIAIITETVEDLLDRIDARQLTLTAELAGAIGNGYQALVEYLDELLSGMPHQPVRLFPYYRALLEARGAERIHPADLFFPNLAVRPQLPPADPGADVRPSRYMRLRHEFEKALLPFLKSTNRDAELANAAAMRAVVDEIERLQTHQQTRAFWWVMHGLAEAVAAGQIPNEIYVKQLFARINLQIRRLSQGSPSIAERLLRDALFFIARIAEPSPRARQIRAAYQLDGLVPADYDKKRYGQINIDALAAAKERLVQAKNIWNRIAGGDVSFAETFEHEMRMLADAGSKLNSAPLSKLLRELKGIARHAAHAKPGDMLGLEMATSLLFVENALGQISRLPDNFPERADAMTARLLSVVAGEMPAQSAPWLDDMSREAQQRQTMTALAGEMQNSLRQVEKMLDEYFRDPSQRLGLGQLDQVLHQIEGALAVLDQDDAVRTVQHTREAVKRFAASEPDVAPEQNEFQQVAQNVGALSFFIETLQLQSEEAKKRFSFDESSGTFQARLIEPPEPEQTRAEEALLPEAPAVPDAPEETRPAQGFPTVEDELAFHQQQSAELAMSLSIEPDNQALQEQLKESLEQIRLDATLVDNPEANDRAQAGIEILGRSDFSASPQALAEIITATVPAAAAAEPLPPLVAPQTDEAIDAELLEIFLCEAEEVLGTVKQTMPESRNQPHNQEHLTTLRRCFHTLKGSGRMVGLMAYGEAAWSIEQVLNLRLSEARSGDAELYALLDKATELLGAWVQDLKLQGKSSRTPDALIAAAARVKAGERFEYIEEPAAQEAASAATVQQMRPAATDAGHAQGAGVDRLAPFDLQLEPQEESQAAAPPDAGPDAATEDASAGIAAQGPDAPEAAEVLIQAEEIELSDAEYAMFGDAQEPGAAGPAAPAVPQAQEAQVSDQPVLKIAEVIEFPTLQAPEVRRDDNVKRIGDLEISVPLHNIYLAETDELVRVLAQDFAEWRHEPEREVNIQAVHAAHSLAGSSATVGFMPLQEVAHALEMVLQTLARTPVCLTQHEFDTLEQTIERLKLMLQKFALGEMPAYQPEYARLLASLRQDVESRGGEADVLPQTASAPEIGDALPPVTDEWRVPGQATAAAETVAPADFELMLEPLAALEEGAAAVQAESVSRPPLAAEAAAATARDDGQPERDAGTAAGAALPAAPFAEPVFAAESDAAIDPALELKDELDADLMPVFLEEGRDILPQMGTTLRGWQEQPAGLAAPQSMLRSLHTLKGSARMAGAMNLGQHLHDMETRIENVMRLGTPSPLAIDELLIRYDQALQMFEQLQNPHQAQAAPAAAVPASVPEAEPGVTSAAAKPDEPVVLSALMPVQAGKSAAAPAPREARAVAKPAGPVPLVRVRADILDRLVNQAGEVSISRSKLETEVGTLKQSLTELTENVSRLRDQLRELEMQAETQIASNMAQSADREFDPLEFDRFTRLQELTRMVAESVNDVGSVQHNLSRTLESAVGDLATQARLTRELQQDLMRVRMVQFASISERLFRVTRQAAKEVDKRVNLDIRGSAVEIDRGVLERMTGPFEHLLRNAIVHGIEARELRRAAGKNEVGELLVEIRQEGNEVVMQFSDDGQGLNVGRIRDKARRIGLLAEDGDMSDEEVVDLIFHPGFSTAEEITELAGRGIGMDVVRSEAAALGGRVSTWSEPGKGAHFTIHLPLTLAVTQVVLLSTGGRTYAVPSVLVEQVQQLKTNALASAYNDGAVVWQGQRVSLHYLSTLLGDTAASPVSQHYSPLLILKSGNERVAIHVDEVIGNREVVVKNIGPQLARMSGIAGATVLGSGDIVLILNPVPLAQRAAHEQPRAPRLAPSDALESMGAVAEMALQEPAVPASEPVQGLRTQNIVMVVDDSLTVRRVTQRLLTREGYQVVLAKDGVDALEHLQSMTPDVMLVDIEMPRMDGFDLTRNVRGDERTRHIPIIMITSRTAAKHRNYALELGVNEYLGKPYQEEQLLALIAGFIRKEKAVPVS
ncbi:MAG TPA: Hpt domain-containing protein [Noviherbaspirillum sp.]|uniref:hybrid sensor histidine kinase/response regulator n=1 Tax=Noviherbaspirillum sp. TaxID=1926288 RepID=UPI002D2865AA|nr:Hpt domain-containing protein [Noviherbaspirillum sp.]HYD95611.1 Hpt domain-containing protein [Noviherbaspirillum sp.]